MVARDGVGPIINGLPNQLPDIDPDETQEWLESLDGMIDEGADSGPATSCTSSLSAPGSVRSGCPR